MITRNLSVGIFNEKFSDQSWKGSKLVGSKHRTDRMNFEDTNVYARYSHLQQQTEPLRFEEMKMTKLMGNGII